MKTTLLMATALNDGGIPVVNQAPPPTNLVCGQTIAWSINATGEVNQYVFDGNAGNKLVISFTGARGCNGVSGFDYHVGDVYAPSGALVTQLNGCSVWSSTVTLPTNGTYVIKVHDNNYLNSGPYALNLQSPVDGGCNSTSIACGQTITNSIGRATEVDAYNFTGVAGGHVAFAFTGARGCSGVSGFDYHVADVYDPTGALVTHLNGCSALASNVTLPANGTYTILVHDDNYLGVGPYTLGLQSFAGGGCNSTSIACGQTITNSISQATEVDAYNFTGVAGDKVAIFFTGARGCNGVSGFDYHVADVYNPSGTLVTHLNGCSALSSNVTLPANGTYTVLVHDDNYLGVGPYTLGLQSFAGGGCNGASISCGQTISNSISRATEVDAYHFIGVAGERVTVLFTGARGCDGVSGYDYHVADIYSPSGAPLAQLNGCSALASNVTLPANGTYTILVHDDNYLGIGPYTLGLQSFAGGGCNSTLISCGQTITNSISQATEVDAYYFMGVAGEHVAFAFTGARGCNGVSGFDYHVADVYDPSGTLVTRLDGCSRLFAKTNLPSTGAYTIVVHDDNYSSTGPYTLRFTVDGGCVQLTTGSAVVRTQQVSCIPLSLNAASPVSYVGFTVTIPASFFTNVTLDTGARFTNATFVAGSDSQWLVRLQTSAAQALFGQENLGSLCFTPSSIESAFVPITVTDLVATNVDNTVPTVGATGNEIVVIANRPLLRASHAVNSGRLVTTFGKANTGYEIRYTADIGMPSPWTLGMTNLVPESMRFTQPLVGPLTNAPILFLRANER